MNKLTFNFGQKAVRVINEDNQVWFVLDDVARALGYSHTPHAARVLDADEASVRYVDREGGKRRTTTVSESGIYHLVFKSKKPEAQKFRKWVTSEVLPAIRSQGHYHDPARLPKSFETLQFENSPLRILGCGHHRPLFVAKDVASAMGFRDTRNVVLKRCVRQTTVAEYLRHVAPDAACIHPLRQLPYQTVLIDESDVYRLAVRSTLPAATRFVDWFSDTALPFLRQQGENTRQPSRSNSNESSLIDAKSLEFAASIIKAGSVRYRRLSEQMKLVKAEVAMLETLVGQMYDPICEANLSLCRYADAERVEEFSIPPNEYRLKLLYQK